MSFFYQTPAGLYIKTYQKYTVTTVFSL